MSSNVYDELVVAATSVVRERNELRAQKASLMEALRDVTLIVREGYLPLIANYSHPATDEALRKASSALAAAQKESR